MHDSNIIDFFKKTTIQHPVMDKEEEKQSFVQLRYFELNNSVLAEKQKNTIALSNIKLVFSIVKNFKAYSLTYDDLVQEGVVGLMRAIDLFDHERNFKFSTYATYWIVQSVMYAISSKDRLIHVSANVQELHKKIERAIDTLSNKLGRDPTIEEIAKQAKIHKRQVKDYSSIMSLPSSIHEPLKDTRWCLEDILGDKEQEDFSEHIIFPKVKERVLEKVRRRLNEQELKVFTYLFGLEDGISYTITEIADFMNVSKERIRQIKVCIFKKLKINGEEFITKYARQY
jgi:RNA polymerase primary sigma factor